MDELSNNIEYIERLYSSYKNDPKSISENWEYFFSGYEFSGNKISEKELSVLKLINAYRARGHLISNTNPVGRSKLAPQEADLNLEYFNLSESDLDTIFDVAEELSIPKNSLRKIIEHVQATYCGAVSIEFRYMAQSNIRRWLHENMEPIRNQPNHSNQEKIQVFKELVQAVEFERFLHIKYVGRKRFSLEGLESVIPALRAMFSQGALLGVKEFVLGMPHRGRLNVLTNVFQKDVGNIFAEFEDKQLFSEDHGYGDVKYHLGYSSDIKTKDDLPLHITLLANPSHLEAVNPLVLGNTRSKWERIYNKDNSAIIPVIIHGDAAISGQGIVYETLNMSNLDGYKTNGVIHIIFNNQVGFTANYYETRSSMYCTDIAKVNSSPILHVNADDPLAVVYALKMAVSLRQKFNIDVYVDIIGYRRYGHNEGDEPRFTQPLLYEMISKHPSVLEIYKQRIVAENVLSDNEAQEIIDSYRNKLEDTFQSVLKDQQIIPVQWFNRNWRGYRKSMPNDFERSIETGVDEKTLKEIITSLSYIPENYSNSIMKKLERIIISREKEFYDNKINWGLAESLACGSLLLEDIPARISGQDCCRGTFSHRHAVLINQGNEDRYIFLNHIREKQELLQVYNSHLSEYGVLGFEYGYSLANPKSLVIWEAQFGDFSNGAQIIIDQFISSAETKWQRFSGLTLFLPHGYEGQGPEHSSARIERFLSLCAQYNMYVAYPTTPANLFHILRRQVLNEFRIPLILFTPKSMLRNPKVISTIKDLKKGGFQEIIDDMQDYSNLRRVILCTGKIYYELLEYKQEQKIDDVAIVRIEQLYPIPKEQDKNLIKKYSNIPWYWVQEEPQNMGAWSFIKDRFQEIDFKIIAKPSSATPAHGSFVKDRELQAEVIKRSFE